MCAVGVRLHFVSFWKTQTIQLRLENIKRAFRDLSQSGFRRIFYSHFSAYFVLCNYNFVGRRSIREEQQNYL